ncbi:aconitate hydratase [Sulfitobacter mediterraneus]|uniref:aconitate hydratase n=1 Tax=Sulfitobacter mediterraneus TaxID=83219 RepID=UPI0021A75152|nr:aconitate hydratase AcnA [Sulfitobacter mediterraneus]UWR10324.1 aconitate hydratase AcnA [Sulfitobacter mediterraneus]
MDSFKSWRQSGRTRFVDLNSVAAAQPQIETFPVTRLIMLEFLLRSEGTFGVTSEHVKDLLSFGKKSRPVETMFRPARLVMQDYAGMAALIDVASLRSDAKRRGLTPEDVDASLPIDLVVDHSMITHVSGRAGSAARNLDLEYENNRERYAFLKWAEHAFAQLNVVPPGEGIIHQLNMERFSKPMQEQVIEGVKWTFPDTVLGTDSHTTMINGLGTLGWGVGGIEATGVLLGDVVNMLLPRVIGIHLGGAIQSGVLATDIVLRLTETLRGIGVVGAQLEFYGEGARSLSGEDRATISNMCPEFGATSALFPFDSQTASYFARHGQSSAQVDWAGKQLRDNGLDSAQSEQAEFDDRIEFDLGQNRIAIAGPFGPEQRLDLCDVSDDFEACFSEAQIRTKSCDLSDGDIVLAAITSCTNTANPKAMITAGLVAREAARRGMRVNSSIKTTMALGSRSSAEMLSFTGLDRDLATLGFFVDGLGCGACVGNAGDLLPKTADALAQKTASVASVLSGNRNFPGRIHPDIKANYLMSPPMVVAYALLGHVRENINDVALGYDDKKRPVFLKDIWPDEATVRSALKDIETHQSETKPTAPSSEQWTNLQATSGPVYAWDDDSDYLIEPPFLTLSAPSPKLPVLQNATALLVLGDNVTTDHISPVGAIAAGSDAASFLVSKGVTQTSFNSYGARRGNHDVMVRGTFANPHLLNKVRCHNNTASTSPPCLARTPFELSQEFQRQSTQMVVLAGKNYGAGSARDWAAKGTRLLGIKAVIAQSFERIHRSNLVRCGVLPIEAQIPDAMLSDPSKLAVSIREFNGVLKPLQKLDLEVSTNITQGIQVPAIIRLDTEREVEIFLSGGMLKLLQDQILLKARRKRKRKNHKHEDPRSC